MAVPVSAVPNTLKFPGVMPGSFGPDITPVGSLPSFAGGVQIKDAPVSAQVTFTLTDFTGHFSIRDVFVLELVEEQVDEGDPDLPPGAHRGHGGKVKVLEVAGEFDGSGPVQVNKGQYLLVRVKYSALTVDGFFEPTLVIQGDTWETVSIPLSLFPAQIVTKISDTLNIAQGNEATLAVSASSVMGPSTQVTYEMSATQQHTGLTLEQNSLPVESKKSNSGTLTFKADRDAPLGPNQVALNQIAFRPLGFFISVNIVHAAITVNPAIPNAIRILKTPATIQLPVSIHLNGGPPATVSFSPGPLPSGVTMQQLSFPIENDTTKTLEVFIDHGVESPVHLPVRWAAFNGDQTGEMDFTVTIQGETAHWSLGGQTTPATLGGSSELWVNSDGFWSFKGHVHDSGFFDLSYASLIVLDVNNPALESRVFQKDGSVTGTGNPFGSRDDDWAINGRDPFIADNWEMIKNATVHFKLHASAEFFDIAEVVLLPLLEYIGVFKFFIEQAGNINIGGGSSSHSPVECETVITNEGASLHCSVGA